MITRAHLSGAIKLLNANKSSNRAESLRAYLLTEYSKSDVEDVMLDLDSYQEWLDGKNLDVKPVDQNQEIIKPKGKRKK
jgi:hypothetical protein